MVENDLTETAKALINVNQRLQKVEKGGSTGGGNIGGGNTGGGYTPPVGPTVPDSGVNVDPGTSLTGLKQVWSGATKQNVEDKLTLDPSINKNLDNVGDGLQFVFKIVKTPITNGTQGAPVDLMPIATTSTTPVSGSYVCSVPVPISIKKGSFVVGTTLTVKLDGIGEGLAGTTVVAAPELQLTLNNDGTISTKPIEGYSFDKLSEGNTGAYYDVVVTGVITYSVAAPVTPLANGTVLWSGSINGSGNIVLDPKLNADYSNVGSGITLTFGTKWSDGARYLDNPPDLKTMQIAKADLVVGKTSTVATTMKIGTSENTTPESSNPDGTPDLQIISSNAQIHVTVGANKLTVKTDPIKDSIGDAYQTTITQVTTYLN